MTIDFPDGTLRRLQDSCRDTLDQAYCRYSEDRTAETRAAYLKALKIFADLVLRHQPRFPNSFVTLERLRLG